MGEIINPNERLVNYCRNAEDSCALSLEKFVANLPHSLACKELKRMDMRLLLEVILDSILNARADSLVNAVEMYS